MALWAGRSTILVSIVFYLAFVLVACGGTTAPPAMQIVSPADGASVKGPNVKVEVAVTNWKLVPAGAPLAEGEGQLAGIMDDSPYPGDEPAHWDVYFAVSDADAAIARIQELGGSVVRPAEDTPYGRLATVADPTGTQFRLVENNS